MVQIILKINIILLVVVVAGTKADCGCSKTNRDERAKKYERSTDESHQHDSVLKHAKDFDKMSLIPSGLYFVGTNEPIFENDGESPEREVKVDKFYLDKYEVSNRYVSWPSDDVQLLFIIIFQIANFRSLSRVAGTRPKLRHLEIVSYSRV